MKTTTKPLLLLASTLAMLGASPAAHATCSTEPMLGSVCLVAYNFCPRGYASAEGQLLSIAQNQALFALLGTQFGGNGQTTFALPDLRGRTPIGRGTGPGLGPVTEGQVGGTETVQLSIAQMPAHSHSAQLRGTASAGNTDSPAGAVPAKLARSNIYSSSGATDAAMNGNAISVGSSGNSQPVPVRDPYLGMRYCIAMQGIFPSRD